MTSVVQRGFFHDFIAGDAMISFRPGKISAGADADAGRAGAAVAQAFPDFQRRMRASGRWLLGADGTALCLAFVVGAFFVWARHAWRHGDAPEAFFNAVTMRESAVFFGLGIAAILWLDSRGHYRQRLPYWEAIGHSVGVVCIGFIASGFIEFASHNRDSRLWMGFSWVLFGLFSFAGRGLVRRLMMRAGTWRISAVMIGDGATAAAALRAVARDQAMGFAIIDHLPSTVLAEMQKPVAWKQVLMLHDADYIFLALDGSDIERYQTALQSLPRARVPFSIIPPWLGLPSSALSAHPFIMQDVMMLHDTNRLKLPLPRLLKRAVDIALAGTALVMLSPVMAAVAIAVKRDGGPAWFKQARVGRNGHLFECYKFRSMRADAEVFLQQYLAENPEVTEEWNAFQKLKHDVRVTRVGAFIRRTSLDELPQLLNVLKGDMSLVGPRPCLPGQESLYAEDFSFYESVRPGITGPWQVSGRNQLSFRERVALEAWYARNWNLWLDIVIMLKTVPTVLKRGQAF